MNENPMSIEHYAHARTECYKIRNPWPAHCQEVAVLGTVAEGRAYSRVLAAGKIGEWASEALAREVKSVPEGGSPR